MTVRVVGFWEQGWDAPMQEFDKWKYPLREFEVDEFIMCPISGISQKVTEYDNLYDVLEKNSDLTPVFVDEKAEIWLEDFEHPENVLYILGKTSFSPYLINKSQDVISVKIRTKRNKGGFWGHQAISLVLYDRMIKNGNHGN